LTRILLELRRENYIIELQDSKELSFMSLYYFLWNELAILRRYLDNALVKNWIKYLVSSTSVSILFVLKLNSELRLCVNYRNLNAIIIKNRYLLLLIIKTLNRLCETKRFIVLNLKNVYYRIRIKPNNK